MICVGAGVHVASRLPAVERLLASGGHEMPATKVAETTGMSRAAAQRCLSRRHEMKCVEIRLR